MTCTVGDCCRRTVAHELCDMHYRRWKRSGSTDLEPRQRATCTVCGKPVEGHGYCHLHYMRWRRTGNVVDPQANICTVEGCSITTHATRRYCRKHYQRWRKHGDPMFIAAPPNWRGETVGYSGVHHRLRKELGHADTHGCACGATAADWAYNHLDPDQRYHNGMPYSIHAEYYKPMCKKCHRSFDRKTQIA